MAYELRDNSGTLFRNDKREKDSQPHARGEAMIGGVLYEVAAWTKEGRNGRFQSLSFKEKEASRERQGTKHKPEPDGAAFDRAMMAERGMYDRDDPRTVGGANRMAADLDDEIPFAAEWR